MKYFFKTNKEFLIELCEIRLKEFFNSDIYFYHMDPANSVCVDFEI